MSAKSLFDTFFKMGMSREEAYKACVRQRIFSKNELRELKKR